MTRTPAVRDLPRIEVARSAHATSSNSAALGLPERRPTRPQLQRTVGPRVVYATTSMASGHPRSDWILSRWELNTQRSDQSINVEHESVPLGRMGAFGPGQGDARLPACVQNDLDSCAV